MQGVNHLPAPGYKVFTPPGSACLAFGGITLSTREGSNLSRCFVYRMCNRLAFR